MTAALWRYTPLFLIAAAWEGAIRAGLMDSSLLPPFSEVMAALGRLVVDPELYRHAAASLMREVAGFGLAVIVGIALGIVMAWYVPVRILVNPLVRCIYPMPKSALIPVMIMWLGLGHLAKIGLIFLGCLLPVIVSAFNAARGVDTVLIWSAQAAGATRRQILTEIVLPASLPEILAGVRTSLALSFVLLVSSEFLMAREGLGYMIAFLGEGGVYDAMFAAVLLVTGIGFAADRAYLAVARRLLVWRE
ncbi:MAG: ABC transporter permease subunit [Alphaproteobacteria bacterium]|nr:ABC transporter permease subunit [Alphaproteobacteria bacterium]